MGLCDVSKRHAKSDSCSWIDVGRRRVLSASSKRRRPYLIHWKIARLPWPREERESIARGVKLGGRAHMEASY